MEQDVLYGERGGQHRLARLADNAENYGPHVIDRFARLIPHVDTAVDLGAGRGRDLATVKAAHPGAKTIAVEAGREYAQRLEGVVDELHVLDLERDALPFADESIDLFIANQVLEHTKEIFWIFHQVSRSLKVGGHFLFGVPNVASFHNRVLLLAGRQPSQFKMCSAHVRCFSKTDTVRFLDETFPGGYTLEAFGGSQFYPLPKRLSRIACRIAPSAAVCIFFLIRKEREYSGEILAYPARAHFETNFWTGSESNASQY